MKKVLILFLCAVSVICMTALVSAAAEPVVVVSYAGSVEVLFPTAAGPVACKPGMVLQEGSRITTGDESYIEIAFNRLKSNVVRVMENSNVIVKLDGADKIVLVDGEVFTMIRDFKKGEVFQVRTPCAVCGARGTGWSTRTDKDIVTDVAVFDDKVFVRGIKKDGSVMEKEFWIEEGFLRKIKKIELPGKLEKMSEARMSGMRKEFGLGQRDPEAVIGEGSKVVENTADIRVSATEHAQGQMVDNAKNEVQNGIKT